MLVERVSPTAVLEHRKMGEEKTLVKTNEPTSEHAFASGSEGRAGFDCAAGRKPGSYLDEILSVRCGNRIVLLRKNEILLIKAEANYVRVFANQKSYRVRRSIGTVMEKLDCSSFMRIHRSIIVNLTMIQELQACNSGEFVVVLRNGTTVPSSRSYRHALSPLLDRGL